MGGRMASIMATEVADQAPGCRKLRSESQRCGVFRFSFSSAGEADNFRGIIWRRFQFQH